MNPEDCVLTSETKTQLWNRLVACGLFEWTSIASEYGMTSDELEGLIKSEMPVEYLCQIVDRHDDARLRKIAVEALGSRKTKEAVPTLVNAYRRPLLNGNNSNYGRDVQEAAALAIGLIGNDESVHALIEGLHSENTSMQYWAIRASSQTGKERMIIPLMRIVTNPENINFHNRKYAVEALECILSGETLDTPPEILSELHQLQDFSFIEHPDGRYTFCRGTEEWVSPLKTEHRVSCRRIRDLAQSKLKLVR
jgi:hypothetical protein